MMNSNNICTVHMYERSRRLNVHLAYGITSFQHLLRELPPNNIHYGNSKSSSTCSSENPTPLAPRPSSPFFVAIHDLLGGLLAFVHMGISIFRTVLDRVMVQVTRILCC